MASAKLVGLCLALTVVFVNAGRSEYWNNMGGSPTEEGRLASEAMFRSASALFAAMAQFEALDESAGNEKLNEAINSAFDVLENLKIGVEQDYARSPLMIAPDSISANQFLNSMKAYGVTETPLTVADLLLDSSTVVESYLSSLKEFQAKRDIETYRALRLHLNAALAVGEAGSAFLRDIKR